MALIDHAQSLLPRLDLQLLENHVVDPTTKGFPLDAPAMRVADIGDQGWNVLEGDLPLPLAVIRRDVLTTNSRWMTRFAAENGLVIAPHGKTTMAPQLFDQQIADGAWAITVATAQQLAVCRRFGVGRVIVANQPIGAQSVDACFRALQEDRELELYCLADSVAGVGLLAEGARRNPPPETKPLRVLVEIGFMGGRAGARNRTDALAVARSVAATSGLALAGFECFEGLLPDPAGADGLIEEVAAIAAIANDEGLLPAGAPMILTAGGSAFFDRVGERFGAVSFDRPLLKILRSGCYLTHDFDRLCGGLPPDRRRDDAPPARGRAGGRARSLGLCSVPAGKRTHDPDDGKARCELQFVPAGTAALVSPWRNDGASRADAPGPRGRRPQRPALSSRHTG